MIIYKLSSDERNEEACYSLSIRMIKTWYHSDERQVRSLDTENLNEISGILSMGGVQEARGAQRSEAFNNLNKTSRID